MYLKEYVKNSQAQYPSISVTPLHCLRHILYVNGNGYTLQNGNLATYFGILTVELKDLYKNVIPYEEYEEKYRYKQFEEESADLVKFATILRKHKGLSLDEDSIWQDAVNHYNERYEKLDSVENYTDDQLKNADTYYNIIVKSDYIPMLHLSENYYLQNKFTSETDRDTLEVALAMSEAYIKAYNEYLSGSESMVNKKSSLFKSDKEMLERIINKDRELLVNDCKNIRRYLDVKELLS